MVSPVFHKYEFPNGDSITTDVPAQIVLSPMASITGLGIELITTSIGADSPMHPSIFSTVTVYSPGVFTTIDCVVSPVDH